ncbi:response regulator [Paenibacillus chartarius]|uniref:Response regulator n=1 Tax=Paenibacillus chartarius TaxID=747481 RepID=A0ABV6DPP1_9BACL
MPILNVMIVDDEILAIEHLRQLIDWEGEGFRLAGEFIRPLQALSKVAELKPDLIIADIRMPNLDGIEFSKRVLASGSRCRILLLTSYKEFEYVKEAMRIGVVSYLVKHELEPDSLRSELAKVRASIEEERHRSAMVLRQYLKELTGDQVPAEELAAEVSQYEQLKGKQFMYVLAAAEEPFPVMQVKGAGTPTAIWNGRLPELPAHQIELAHKKNGRIGFLLLSAPVASRRETAQLYADAVTLLKAFLEKGCPGVPICAAYSEPFDNPEELNAIHRKTALQLDACLFLRGTKLAGPGSAAHMPSPDWSTLPGMEEVIRLLHTGGAAAAGKLVETQFDAAARTRSVPYLTQLCGTLVSALDAVRAERGLTTLQRLAEEGAVRTEEWRTLDGIKTWLLARIEETAAFGNTPPYSRKIREACDYIAAHCEGELSAETIAHRIGISGEHLRHLFKQETGQTLHDYLTACRMERAKALLESGHFKLYEISDKVGYKSSHYFSKIFYRTVGMTPLEYAETRGASR